MMMPDWLRTLTQSADQRRAEQITAYVDGQLAQDEAAQVEALLQQDAALRARVAALQQLKGQLRHLPTHPAPRSFILDPLRHGRRTPTPSRPPSGAHWHHLLRAATAFAALIFVVAAVFTMIQYRPATSEMAMLAHAPAEEGKAAPVSADLPPAQPKAREMAPRVAGNALQDDRAEVATPAPAVALQAESDEAPQPFALMAEPESEQIADAATSSAGETAHENTPESAESPPDPPSDRTFSTTWLMFSALLLLVLAAATILTRSG